MIKLTVSALPVFLLLLFISNPVMAQIPDTPPRVIEAPPTVEICTLEHTNEVANLFIEAREQAPGMPRQVPSAEFDITFTANCDGEQWPQQAREAMEYATDIWATHITSGVPIRVNAVWHDIAGLGSAGPTLLVRGGPESQIPGSLEDTWYPIAQANAMSGIDFLEGREEPTVDIQVSMSCQIENWYFGRDQAPAGTYDFTTVALHELGHGLGFLGTMTVDELGQIAEWGRLPDAPVNDPGYPLIYDRFPEDGNGREVVDDYPNRSFELYQAVTGRHGGLYLGSPEAAKMNGFDPVPLYAPQPWAQGSSYSHLNTETYRESENALMVHQMGTAFTVRSPGSIFCGMLSDHNWPLGAGCNDLLNRDALIVIESDAIDFRLTNVGNPVEETVTITNSNTSSDPMSGLITVDDGDPFTIVNNESFELAPGESVDVTIQFNPINAGEFEGEINVFHDATNLPYPVTIQMTGRALERGVLARLEQNYPNPFRDRTYIEYELPEASDVHLELFDAAGRRVTTLLDEQNPPGPYEVVLDAGRFSSGVYYYRIRIGDFVETKSLVIIR